MVLGVSPSQALAQQDSISWPAANRLTVAIAGRLLEARGDTVRVGYAVTSAPSSEQAGEVLAVRSTGRVLNLVAPTGWYASSVLIADSTAVTWDVLVGAAQVRPGQTQAGFELVGIGELDVVGFRVQGQAGDPEATEETAHLLRRPPSIWENAAAGQTIGLVAITPRTPVARLERLVAHLTISCDNGWIPHTGSCTSLRAQLDNAGQALGRNQPRPARKQLEAFMRELDAQDARVAPEASALLRLGARRLLSQLE
jgi:hypothetical protein